MNDFLSKYSTAIGLIIASISLFVSFLAIHHYRLSKKKNSEENFDKRFRKTREFIKNNRKLLQKKAREYYEKERSDNLCLKHDLIAGDCWIPECPVSLGEIRLEQIDDIEPVLLKKRKQKSDVIEGAGYLTPAAGQFDSYSDAIREVDKPKVFEGNSQYRLLKVEKNRLIYSKEKYSYFDKINFGGFLDYELAESLLFKEKMRVRESVIKKLTEPHQYIILTGVNTLTIIVTNEGPRFLMHSRGSNETATSMNTMHVIPAGEFQPSCESNISWEQDFDLWKNILRESAEELLLVKEYAHINKDPFNYLAEPYLTLEKEKRDGNIKAYYLGIGLDPNTLQGEILTCVVYREETFLKIFHHDKTKDLLRINPEGELTHEGDGKWGYFLTPERIDDFLNRNSLSACKAILQIVLKNIDLFNNCFRKVSD